MLHCPWGHSQQRCNDFLKNIKIKTGILSKHLNIITTLQKFKNNFLQHKISDNTSKR